MILQHNIAALNVRRQLGVVNTNLAKSTEKLASGYRINRAADDAAGLAVSEKLRSQVRGLTRASENVEDGISYVRTADGALSEVSDMLQRIRELSVQASNTAVNEIGDRAKIQQEINEIRNEVGRVFTDTEFNKKRIWDPARADADTIQVGSVTEPVASCSYSNGVTTITNANRYNVPQSGYQLSADENGVRVSWKNWKDQTITSDLIPWDPDPYSPMTINLQDHLSGVTGQIDPGTSVAGIQATFKVTPNTKATKEEIFNSYNHTYFAVVNSTPERAELYGTNNVRVQSVSINYKTELSSGKNMEKGDTSFIAPYPSNENRVAGNAESIYKFNFKLRQEGGGSVDAEAVATGLTFSSGDRSDATENTWWRWVSYVDGNGNPQKYKSGISYSQTPSNTGIVLGAGNTSNGLLGTTNGTGGTMTMSFDIRSGGKSIGSMVLTMDVTAADCQKYSGQPDVATQDVMMRFNALKGMDIYGDSASNSDGGALLHQYTSTVYSSSNGNYTTSIPVMESAGVIREYIQAGANAGQGIDMSYRHLSARLLGIGNTQVDTLEHAQSAIVEVDKALDIVSEERARFGAYENRFSYASKVDKNTAENLQSAESRFRDTDMAEEISIFSKEKILQQAGTAMLANANQSTQSVLSLLNA